VWDEWHCTLGVFVQETFPWVSDLEHTLWLFYARCTGLSVGRIGLSVGRIVNRFTHNTKQLQYVPDIFNRG